MNTGSPSPARQIVKEALDPSVGTGQLRLWGDGSFVRGNTNDKHPKAGLNAVDAAIDKIAATLRSIGKREGAREGAARSYLKGIHERLSTARAAFLSVGRDADGPAVVAIEQRLGAAMRELEAAQSAFHSAPADRAVLMERRADLDVADAKLREIHRDLAALVESVRYPALPSLDAFTRAEQESRALLSDGLRNQDEVMAMHAALEQGAAGAKGDPAVARLWVCFETSAAVYDLRWRRYLAAGGVKPADA